PRGLGVDTVPTDSADLLALLFSDRCVPALPFDLAFPEVFFPNGDRIQRSGFDTLFGNPPWDKIMPVSKEFFAQYDFEIVGASSKAERDIKERQLMAIPVVHRTFGEYWESFERDKRILLVLYKWQNVEVNGQRSGAQPDLYRYFAERGTLLTNKAGFVGWV